MSRILVPLMAGDRHQIGEAIMEGESGGEWKVVSIEITDDNITRIIGPSRVVLVSTS